MFPSKHCYVIFERVVPPLSVNSSSALRAFAPAFPGSGRDSSEPALDSPVLLCLLPRARGLRIVGALSLLTVSFPLGVSEQVKYDRLQENSSPHTVPYVES